MYGILKRVDRASYADHMSRSCQHRTPLFSPVLGVLTVQNASVSYRRPFLVDYISFPWTLLAAAAYRCSCGEVGLARLCQRIKRLFVPRFEGCDGLCSPDIGSSDPVLQDCGLHKPNTLACCHLRESQSLSR